MNDNITLLACVAGAIAFTILVVGGIAGFDSIREMWRKQIKDYKDDSNDDDKGDIHKVNY